LLLMISCDSRDFAMVLMDPMISNFLSSCIVRWLRNSVDDDVSGFLVPYHTKTNLLYQRLLTI
jgi:hypothetical protein